MEEAEKFRWDMVYKEMIDWPSLPVTLAPFQQEGAEYILSRKYSMLADDMGLGKTYQSLSAALLSGAKRILIICPASIQTQWMANVKLFFDYPVEILDNKGPFAPLRSPNWVLITSYGKAKNQRLKALDYDFVIIDEAHFLKNPKANRTRQILGKGSFLNRAKQVTLLTGTPMLNRPAELYIILKTFCPELLGQYKNWHWFVVRYCGWAGQGSNKKTEKELGQKLASFFLRRTKEEVLEQLPSVVETVIPVEFPSALAKSLSPNDAETYHALGVAKTEAIIEHIKLCKESIDKILVVCYHQETIQKIQTAFPDSCVIKGGMSNESKAKILDSFITSPEVRILIGQVNVISFGVDGLQKVCDRIIFGELYWTPGVLQQAIDRLNRIGQVKETIFVDYIFAKGTLDEEIWGMLKNKQECITNIVERSRTNYMDVAETKKRGRPARKETQDLEPQLKVQEHAMPEVLKEAFGEFLRLAAVYVTEAVKDALKHNLPVTKLEGPPEVKPVQKANAVPDDFGSPVAPPAVAPPVVNEPEFPSLEYITTRANVYVNRLLEGGVDQATAVGHFQKTILQGLSSNVLAGLADAERAIADTRITTANAEIVDTIKKLKESAATTGLAL